MSTTGRIKILVVDRTRMGFLKEGQELYLDRLSHYTKVEWIEIRPMKHKKGLGVDKILKQEASLLKRRIRPSDYVIALDSGGRAYSSERFAFHLQKLLEQGRTVLFLVGGPLGIEKRLLGQAHETISLSPLTFTHEWSRVLLLEQIYRAFTIIRGENYHK